MTAGFAFQPEHSCNNLAASLMHWIVPSEKNADNAALEKRFREAGDQLRANSELKSQEYSEPVLGLINEMLRQVLSGLTSVVNGLACMRNKMNDAHVSSHKASKHHAKLAMNSPSTFADFIFDTYSYQRGTGELK